MPIDKFKSTHKMAHRAAAKKIGSKRMIGSKILSSLGGGVGL